jgi:HK97 family phage prohead protease
MPIPTNGMVAEAKKGLAWREEFNRGGTEVGVARARDIINKKDLSDETIGRMVSYFARHEVDKEGEGFYPNQDGFPSAGRIAWALWGGDPGKTWADNEWDKIQNSKGSVMANTLVKRKTLELQNVSLKFASDGVGTFSGYASVFGGLDSYNDTIMAGAYKSVIEKISSGAARMPKMFINHKSWELPVGKWLTMYEDTKGLLMEGELTPGNPDAAIVKAAMQHETIDGLSIGYMLDPSDVEFVDKGNGPVRVIKNISELVEVSIVTFPADDAARVDLSSVKSALDCITSIKEFEDFLREAAGFSKSLATATASRAKRIFAQSESDKIILPQDIQQLIADNLKNARTL